MTITNASTATEQGMLRLRANREIYRVDVVEADVDKQVFLGFLRDLHGPDTALDAATAADMRKFVNEQILATGDLDGGIGFAVRVEGDEEDAPEDGWTNLVVADLDAPLPITDDAIKRFFYQAVAAGRLECVSCTHNPAAVGLAVTVIHMSGKDLMVRSERDGVVRRIYGPSQVDYVTALTSREITLPSHMGNAFYEGTVTWRITPKADDR